MNHMEIYLLISNAATDYFNEILLILLNNGFMICADSISKMQPITLYHKYGISVNRKQEITTTSAISAE